MWLSKPREPTVSQVGGKYLSCLDKGEHTRLPSLVGTRKQLPPSELRTETGVKLTSVFITALAECFGWSLNPRRPTHWGNTANHHNMCASPRCLFGGGK